MITERFKLYLVAIIGLAVTPLVGISVANGDIFWMIVAIGLVGLFLLLFGPTEYVWTLLILGVLADFRPNFLKFNISFGEVATVVLFGNLIIRRSILGRRKLRFGPFLLWVPMLIVVGIIFIHNFKGGLGLKILGSGEYGARRHLPFFMALMSYLIVFNSVEAGQRGLRRLPLLYLIFVIIGSLPGLITSIFPGTAPIFFALTGTVNTERYFESIATSGVELKRIGAIGGIGIAIQLYLVSKYSLRTWLRPQRWWVVLVSALALYMCIRSGFRSSFIGFLIVTGIAAILALRWASVIAAVAAVAICVILAVGNNNLFRLPVAAQRALSIMPGNWDSEAVYSAEGSTDFREIVQDIYLKSYFNPFSLIGHGFKYDPNEAAKYEQPSGKLPPREVYRGFVVRKQFHIGWISLFDSVGWIGSFAFVWLTLTIFLQMRSWIRQHGLRALSPTQRWLIIMYGQTILPFWTVFGDLSNVIVMFCIISALTGVLFPRRVRLRRTEPLEPATLHMPASQMA